MLEGTRFWNSDSVATRHLQEKISCTDFTAVGGGEFLPLGSIVEKSRSWKVFEVEKNDETYFLAVFETGGPDANVAGKHVAMSRVGLRTCLF